MLSPSPFLPMNSSKTELLWISLNVFWLNWVMPWVQFSTRVNFNLTASWRLRKVMLLLKSTCEKLLINLPEARRVADGCHGFSIFKGAVSWRVHSQVRRLYRTATGSTSARVECHHLHDRHKWCDKTLCNAGLFIHQYRSWQKKPCINSALQNICRCAPQADSETLKNLLEFCFHDLSPRKIGATLVWCLTEPSAEEWKYVSQLHATKMRRELASLRCRVAPSADLYWWSSYFGCSSTSDRCGSAIKYSEASKRLMRHVPEPDIPQPNDSPTILPKELYLSFRAMVRSLFSPTAWVWLT